MPKIIVKFEGRESLVAHMECEKELVPFAASYLAVAGHRLIQLEAMGDERC